MSQRDSALNYVWDINLLAWVVMQQPILHTDLPITVTITGVATAANQTNGTQLTQITDGSSHFQPTGDAVGRSIAVQVNDGTNVLGTTSHPVQTQQNGVVIVAGAVVAL